MPAKRLLVIDENLNPRLATELNKRGFVARRVRYFGLSGEKDHELLPALKEQLAGSDWMLITADDRMPHTHGPLLDELGITVATIDPRVPDGRLLEEWRRDVVHRWVHKMEEQAQGTIRRYSERAHRSWTPIKR
ncbi:MAG: DUF5615 family PIN-like protein [Actinobacteria bacterium]|jgi:hypothetical protein|nr:DUF5615 family PIN-like protein [Actinomycetota bacterium]MBU1493494.1 DUF5615 family PIN-like protein [Actinomycetota bacterium]MBU1865483.1 DUF5615 family PIN-like protein [Actinomycetota bacterium]